MNSLRWPRPLVAAALLSASIAYAVEPPDISRPPRGVSIGVSTQPLTGPLDTAVTLELVDGTLAALLDEVGKQTKTEYILIQGVGQCRVSAFIRGLTTREILQLTLEVGGLTYQSAGRSNRYVVTRRKGGPSCPRVDSAPEGTCSALDDNPISLQCKNGPLSSLVHLLYDQTGASFLVWNEAVNQPTTIKLTRATLPKALRLIEEKLPIDVQKVGKKDVFLLAPRGRKPASEQEIGTSTASFHVGTIYRAPSREEPPANPDIEPSGAPIEQSR